MNQQQLQTKIKEIMTKINLFRKLMELLRWKEKLEMEIMARITAREEGLSRHMEDTLIAVLKCESGLNPKAINKNRDGTYDWGICQYNSYWYVKKGLISKADCFNPEKAVRFMCKRFKKGWAKDWVCYSMGKYRRFI